MRAIKILLTLLILFALSLLAYNFLPEQKLPEVNKIDSLEVIKSERQLLAYADGKVIRTYKISLGKNPVGPKQCEGDKRTPEGSYVIFDKNPNSGYHKNLGISYPNDKDIERHKGNKEPIGGEIKIHGLKNGLGFIGKFQRWFDWTAGCIAMTNEEVDELYKSVPIGTKIEIKP